MMTKTSIAQLVTPKMMILILGISYARKLLMI